MTDTDQNELVAAPLPQPNDPASTPYQYLFFDKIESEFFPSQLTPQTLSWVLLSKGKRKSQLSMRARVLEEPDSENRVLVQYPKGSTYRVRRKNLMPVLEHQSNLILVASETNDYRRSAIVHTLESDSFMEIGCDFGILVDSVHCESKIGIDKSEESIGIAKERYPSRDFLLADVFEDFDASAHKPTVVAIDINGNRLLPAVIDCIQLVMDAWSPRLIVVKSRELYAKMKADEESVGE
ncbi:unnamed protein product [Cylindrotheca closterium]|uniref:Uncharacterized protein n=1 Tax=Cylindrotheca closterium TaxID=2856 RepID=A0AAD2CR52_9STRA|nr:unnamed protein product [Cylindrotheca closterium]